MSVILPHISKTTHSLDGIYMFYDSNYNINIIKNHNKRILKHNINILYDFYILEEDKKNISLMPMQLHKDTQSIIDSLCKIIPLLGDKSIYVLCSRDDFITKLSKKIRNKKIKKCIKDKKNYIVIY